MSTTRHTGTGGAGLAGRARVLRWSLPLAVLVVTAGVAGLLDPSVYVEETENWAMQAKGQDVGNLVAVAVLLVAAWRHHRGSYRAGLVWVGTLLYLIYAFVVYAVAIRLNYLFLVYVGALGLSAWAVIFHLTDLRAGDHRAPVGRRTTVAAWVLIGTGVMFGGLWLSELVPAALGGDVPASLTEAGLGVNPIHVIDLSMVLPGFVICGTAALVGRSHGLFWLAPWLVFSALMGSSIVAAMLIMMVNGVSGTLPATLMVSIVVTASLVSAIGYFGGWTTELDPGGP